MINQKLLEILVCPKCKNKVSLDESGLTILCSKCGTKYPVIDDIPVMLIDEAKRT